MSKRPYSLDEARRYVEDNKSFVDAFNKVKDLSDTKLLMFNRRKGYIGKREFKDKIIQLANM